MSAAASAGAEVAVAMPEPAEALQMTVTAATLGRKDPSTSTIARVPEVFVSPSMPAQPNTGDPDGAEETEFDKEFAKLDEEEKKLLNTDPRMGLSSVEAQRRLQVFGPNELPEKKIPKWRRLLSYFIGPLAYLIEIAVVLSGILQDWVDFAIILFLLFVNAAIGYFEEGKAESALDALKKTISSKSKVVRDGKQIDVDANELVPGDVIVVRIGDIVPADCELLGIGANGEPVKEGLLIDEAALTGESLPSEKHKGTIAYSSSVCKQGQMLCLVTKTGANTFIGRAAKLIAGVDQIGEFQRIVTTIGNFLIGATILLATILLIVELAADKALLIPTLQLVLVIVIAAIPVGLPTVLSVTLAVGASHLAEKKVVIKQLPSIEELASVDILCSDKTGTITLNKLTVDEPWLVPPHTEEELMLTAYLCSEVGTQDAIEKAVETFAVDRVPALKSRPEGQTGVPGFKQLSFIPFNPKTKYTTAEIKEEASGKTFIAVKGAPPNVIKLAGDRADATAAVDALAARGLRALAVARSDDGGKSYQLLGLISLLDPPREDSGQTIKECQNLGVNVKMITGDQQIIAKEVAKRLGMHTNILEADVLDEGDIADMKLYRKVVKADGFAHVIPEHKYKVVAVLQTGGHVVAMTGDGVNDAPALKKANIGFAVEGCTEAARSAAPVVLLHPGLSTIVDGIKMARQIFQRMRSYALYRIAASVHILVFLFISILALDFSIPSLLVIILAVLNDAATLGIAYDNTTISPLPDKWRIGQLFTMSSAISAYLVVTSFAFFFVARGPLGLGQTDGRLGTAMWLQISTIEHFLCMSTRLPGWMWELRPSLIFVVTVFITLLIPFFMSVFGTPSITPAIGWGWSFGITGYCLALLLGVDAIKVYLYRIWHLELIAKIAPLPKNRQRLAERRAAIEQQARLDKNVQKVRNVVQQEKVLLALRPTTPKPGVASVAAASAPAQDKAAPVTLGATEAPVTLAAPDAANAVDQVVAAATEPAPTLPEIEVAK
ncbi:plasma-membrane proton-efflux P-type ATPase [Hyaloraphidium curvatum]|nr:plasma-membrane proton-efflux P-type ATPase [Hyaloraphidium curvatum]